MARTKYTLTRKPPRHYPDRHYWWPLGKLAPQKQWQSHVEKGKRVWRRCAECAVGFVTVRVPATLSPPLQQTVKAALENVLKEPVALVVGDVADDTFVFERALGAEHDANVLGVLSAALGRRVRVVVRAWVPPTGRD